MSNDKCPSCGAPWTDHLGPTGVCEQLQEAKRQIADLRSRLLERLDHATALHARHSELVERNRELERMLGLVKGDPMRLIMHEYFRAVEMRPKGIASIKDVARVIGEEVLEALTAINDHLDAGAPLSDAVTEIAQVGGVALRSLIFLKTVMGEEGQR